MMPSQQQLDRLVTGIVSAVHPLRVLLFGSVARGEAGTSSDIDLLVVVPEGIHRRRTAQAIYREVRGVGVPFDVLVATPDDLRRHRDNVGLIYHQVLREGKELYAA